MASEYLKWKYRDVKPDEPPPPLTGWPKVKNWLYYHAVYLIAGAAVLAIAGSMLWNILGIGKVKPDYIFAYVAKTALPHDTEESLRRELSSLGEDLNGDGQVSVELRSYVSGGSSSAEGAAYAAASQVTLAADITQGESVFFITDNPATLQASYQILADREGKLPAEDDYSAEGRALRWADCPALAALELGDYSEDVLGSEIRGSGQEFMGGMYIGRRGFYEEKQEKYRDGDIRLWEAMTKGAVWQ